MRVHTHAHRQTHTYLPVLQAEEVEDVGYYFKYLGGVQLPNAGQPLDAPGSARLLVVSNIYGITVLSDLYGEL